MHNKKPKSFIRGRKYTYTTLGLAALFSLKPLAVIAADSTWLANPATNNYLNNANWSAGLPGGGDTAFFDTSTQTALVANIAGFDVGGWTFNPGASSYTIDIAGSVLNFVGTGIVINGGSLVIDSSDDARLSFLNSSSAGSATIFNSYFLHFEGNSTADNATIINNPNSFFLINGITPASISVGSLAGAGDFGLGSKQLITGGLNTSTTISGVLSGNGGSLEKIGTGTLTLSGANTYTGGTTIAAGTLQIGDGGTTGSIVGDVVNDSSLVFDRSNAMTYAGVISGTGSVTQAGAGTTTLTGANTYTGDTIISAGTLQIGASERIADTSDLVINGGTFDLNNFDEAVANLSGTGGNINIGAGGTGTLTVNQTVDQTYAGNFSGASGASQYAIVKNGAATLTLTGTNSQTGRGLVHINDGRLTVDGGNAIGDSQLVVGAGEFELLSDETIGLLAMSSGGDILLNDNTLTINAPSGVSGINNAAISGTGNIIMDGTGILMLSGASAYTGSTTINGGVLRVDNLSALGNNSAVTVNTDGILMLSTDLAIGSLAGNGAVDLSFGGGRQLTAGGDNTSTTFSGVLVGGGDLNKTGTGKLILTGNNTYTGGTTISDGTLQIGNGGFTGSINGPITNNASLIFNRLIAVTFGGDISGTGTFAQAGAGTTTFTGTNTYTGGTTISDGALQIGNGGTTGSIVGDVVNDSSLVFNRSNAMTYAGVISGTGSLTQAGAGTTTLAGANTYTGDTIISGGTLRLGANNRIANSSDLVINGGTFDLNDFDETVANLSGTGGNINSGAGGTGTLTVNQTVNQTYAGDFSGASGMLEDVLIKNGAATLTLTGTNSQTGLGEVWINAGRLAVDGGNAIGDSQMLRGANGEFELLSDEKTGLLAMTGGDILLNSNTLTLNTSAVSGVNGSVISGTGNIVMDGTGLQTLAGASTYTGSTTINGGVLSANNLSALGNDSAVTVNSAGRLSLRAALAIGSLAGDGAVDLSLGGAHQLTSGGNDTSTTFGGVLFGAGGSLNKTGTGNLNLTGINTYSGSTTINGGILSVNGSIANSATTVNAGGTLGGSGTVGSVTINGGTLAPGNSIGTLNVAGNVDFTAGGTYAVEVNAAGASDLINATGTATLTNGTVLVLPEAGNYGLSTDYTILTAAGGLGGTAFNSVSSNLAFLTPTLGYDANNVFLNLTRNDVTFSAVAGTPNQTAVSTVINTLSTSSPDDIQGLVDNLFILTADGASQAYDSLSGVQHTHGNLIALQSINQFKGILFDRIQGNNQFMAHDGKLMLAHNHTDTMTDAGNQLLDGTVSPQRGWWMRGTGNYGDIDDTRNATGADYKAGGIAAGIDFDLNPNLTAGAAFGYTRTDADVANGGLDVDTYQAALYGRLMLEHDYYLTGMTGLGFHNMESNRGVTVGLLNTSAEADYDAWTGNIAIEGGRKLTLNPNTSLTPFMGLEYAHINRDSFTEKDGGVANLRVKQDKQDSLRSSLGARITHSWTTKGYRITPTAELAWVHEFMEDEAGIRAGFSAAPATIFSVDGPELDRDRARLALGLNVQLSNTAHLNLGYQGEFASSDERHDIAATFRMMW